jgi:hypothetical protein
MLESGFSDPRFWSSALVVFIQTLCDSDSGCGNMYRVVIKVSIHSGMKFDDLILVLEFKVT